MFLFLTEALKKKGFFFWPLECIGSFLAVQTYKLIQTIFWYGAPYIFDIVIIHLTSW